VKPNRSILISGPSRTGKTTTAELLAARYGAEPSRLEFVPVGGDGWHYRCRPFWVSVRRDRQGHVPAAYAAAGELARAGLEFVLAPLPDEEGRVVHRQPREPEPFLADAAEQRPVALRVDRRPAIEPQRRRRDRVRRRALAHLEIGHHRRDLAARHVDQSSAQRGLPRAAGVRSSVTTRSPAAAGSSGWRRHCRRSSARTGCRGRRSG